jgi:hypothetical protein
MDEVKLEIERFNIEPRKRRLTGRWTLEPSIDFKKANGDSLLEFMVEEIDKMILEEIIKEAEEQEGIVNSIIPDKLFEV